jgi:hypothetical protein
MAADSGRGLFFWLCETVAFICLFMAGELYKDFHGLAGTAWAVPGVLAAIVGFKEEKIKRLWPSLRKRLPFRKTAKQDGKKVSISAAAMREHVVSRQSLLQRLADEEEKERVKSADWQQLAAKFESTPEQLRGTWNRYGKPATEKWDVGGWTDGDKCRALCRLAGAMLMRSRRVCRELPEEIRNIPDPMDRWLKFLAKLKPFDDYRSGVEPLDDGTKSLVSVGVMNSVAQRSVAACIECAAMEM